jgi:hypothetical protein
MNEDTIGACARASDASSAHSSWGHAISEELTTTLYGTPSTPLDPHIYFLFMNTAVFLEPSKNVVYLRQHASPSSGHCWLLGPVRGFLSSAPLYAAKSKCQAAQTHVHLLLRSLGVRSETLHVRHAVSTTSGSNSDESAGVRWQAEWRWWRARRVG